MKAGHTPGLFILVSNMVAALPLTEKGLDVNLPLETKPPTSPVDTPQIMLEFSRPLKNAGLNGKERW